MNEAPDNSTPRSPRSFRTTHWSLVVAASADSRVALEELCAVYWPPLHWHLRRLGFDATQAEDLTQAFFSRLLEKRLLDFADSRRGRFRTFLLTALRRFVVNEWKHETAVKRGGGYKTLAFELSESETSTSIDDARNVTPDRLFERQWATVVLQQAFRDLEAEYLATGNGVRFDSLVPFLTRETATIGYDELANRWNTTAGALRTTVSRMRTRLRELVRSEIRKTVQRDDEVDDEIQSLFKALSS